MINFTLESTEKNAKTLLDGMWYSELPELLDVEKLYKNLIDILKKIGEGESYESFQLDEQNFIKDYKNIDSPSYLRQPGVEPITYYAFKNNKSLREMQLPNLMHYIGFIYNSLWIFDDLFEKLYCNWENNSSVKNSCSYVVLNELFYMQKDYEEFEEVLLGVFTDKNNKIQGNRVMSSNRMYYEQVAEAYLYGMKMDIESFFPNIYTHYFEKISEMKPFSELNVNKQYFTFLDTFHQKINNNQTKGIPAGTFSAHIAAELCMLCVDSKIREIIDASKIGYVRYVDDLTFFSDSQEELIRIELKVQKVLNDFRLRINGNKTNVYKNVINKQRTNLEEINQTLGFLSEDKEDYTMTINDMQSLKEYIATLIEKEKISQIKVVLTKLLKKIVLNSFDTKNVHQSLFCYVVTLIFENGNLAVHCYRILNELLQEDSLNKCFSILSKKTEMVDEKYSETLLQIWHYYVLVRHMEREEKKEFFQNHAYKLRNPIIYTFFVEDGERMNSHIVGKIKEAFRLEEKKTGWKRKIMYSKWWLPLLKIRMLDSYNYEGIFENNYFPQVLEEILK